MDKLGIKEIYDSGVSALNFIKMLIVLDILFVLVSAMLNSKLFDEINSILFWSAVIVFFGYRAHFRSKIRGLIGLDDWAPIRTMFTEPEASSGKSDI